MMRIDPEQDKDRCDNVLLEYEFALAIHKHDPSLLKILPLMCGPADDRGFTAFPFDKVVSNVCLLQMIVLC